MIKKLLLSFVALVIIGAIGSQIAESNRPAPAPKTPDELAAEARSALALAAAKQLKEMQKDPSSFQVSSAILMADGTTCFDFRSTNSFNALVPGQAVFDGKRILTNSSSEMSKVWNSRCAGKSGLDITSLVKTLG